MRLTGASIQKIEMKFAALRCGSGGPGCVLGGGDTASGSQSQALTHKFWPEMDKERSWERRVRVVAALCCCSGRVTARAEAGDDLQPEATPLARMALVFASVRAMRPVQHGHCRLPVTGVAWNSPR